MEETDLEAYADVRASLYTLTPEELKGVTKAALPGTSFSIEDASKSKLFNVLENYLISLEKECDQGLAILTDLKQKDMGVKVNINTDDVKSEPLLDQSIGTTKTASTSDDHNIGWRKNWKINGTVGDIANCINYMSFLRQVEVAKDKHYK